MAGAEKKNKKKNSDIMKVIFSSFFKCQVAKESYRIREKQTLNQKKTLLGFQN